MLAIVWLVLTFDAGRGQRSTVFGTYAIGMAVISLGAILVPVLGERESAAADRDDHTAAVGEARADAESAREEAASAREDADAHRAEADDLREQVAVRDDELAALRDSQATFELYEDKGGKFRWRLRHRNSNVIADSGQGYSSRTKAFDGIDSVKRNAPNAETTGA